MKNPTHTPGLDEAREKMAKAEKLNYRIVDLHQQRKVYGNAKGLAFHDYTHSVYDESKSVILSGTVERGYATSDTAGSYDAYPTPEEFYSAQTTPSQQAAAVFIMGMVTLVTAWIAEAESDLIALLS